MGTDDAAVFTVEEAVDFSDVHLLFEKVNLFIDQSQDDIRIQFAELSVSNSLIVALMMSWYRRAELAEKKLRFYRLPDSVQKIVEITGLGHTLPIEK